MKTKNTKPTNEVPQLPVGAGNITLEEYLARERRIQGQKTCRSLWNEISEKLTSSQYEKTMGGDMTFKAKALKVMKVSSSKTIHKLCIDLIKAYEHYFEA